MSPSLALSPLFDERMIRDLLLALDLAGAFVFAISGAMLGVRRKLDFFGVLALSFVASSAGGIARDLLVARTPAVLRRELYAVAALGGATLVVTGHLLAWPPIPTAVAGAGFCFGLRLLAIRRGWNLPVASAEENENGKQD